MSIYVYIFGVCFNNNNNKLTFGSFGGKSGKYFLFTCINDTKSYINQINIRSGNRIDGIEVKCTNNKSIKVGGNGGKLNELPVKQDGYKDLQVKSGTEIDKIIIVGKEFGGIVEVVHSLCHVAIVVKYQVYMKNHDQD